LNGEEKGPLKNWDEYRYGLTYKFHFKNEDVKRLTSETYTWLYDEINKLFTNPKSDTVTYQKFKIIKSIQSDNQTLLFSSYDPVKKKTVKIFNFTQNKQLIQITVDCQDLAAAIKDIENNGFTKAILQNEKSKLIFEKQNLQKFELEKYDFVIITKPSAKGPNSGSLTICSSHSPFFAL
jgi:hypothetical protein